LEIDTELHLQAKKIFLSIKKHDIGPPRTNEELREASVACSLVGDCEIIIHEGYLLDAIFYVINLASSTPWTKWVHFQALKSFNGKVVGVCMILGKNEIGTGDAKDHSRFVATEQVLKFFFAFQFSNNELASY
jgi:hypothetical protein